jgi:hypothetical protein
MFKIVLSQIPVKGLEKNDLETYLSSATKIADQRPPGRLVPAANRPLAVNLNCNKSMASFPPCIRSKQFQPMETKRNAK